MSYLSMYVHMPKNKLVWILCMLPRSAFGCMDHDVLPYSSDLSLLSQTEPSSCLCSACRERT